MAVILVVDDEKDTVALLRYMLEKDGHQVLEANDGEAALRAVGLDPAGGEDAAPAVMPEIILLDVMMPKMDGYSVYARLQQSERTQGIPVVVLTAKGGMWELFQNATGITAFL
ncbi:MAG: response regulator, partial [Elusimicrobiota bacterium]